MIIRYNSLTGTMYEAPDDGEYIDRDSLIAALKSTNFRVDYRYKGIKIITKKDLLEILGIDEKELEK